MPASRYIAFLSIAVAGCLIDLTTKSWVFQRLGMPGGKTEWIWHGVLGLETSLNQGALFGLGQGLVPVLAALSLLAAAGVLYWLFVLGAARQWALTVALACVMAGIFGNLYDRLGWPGLRWHYSNHTHPPFFEQGDPVYAVRDWILVMIGQYHWPNFNVADSLLVCGALILLGHAFWSRPEAAAGAARSQVAQSPADGPTRN